MISPHHHQSNGLAERSIQTVNGTLNKGKLNSEDHFLAIFSQFHSQAKSKQHL